MRLYRIAATVLGVAALLALVAWQLQGRTTGALREALALQTRDPSSGAAPPKAEENKDIIEVLGESIAIRRSIEGILVRIENDVAFLGEQQDRALSVAERTHEQLSMIGASLTGSIDASRTSVGRLQRLRTALIRSARLAGAIADELAELDRKLGPSAAGRP